MADYQLKSYLLNNCGEYINAVRMDKRYEYLETQLMKPSDTRGWTIDKDVQRRMDKLQHYHELCNDMYLNSPTLYFECEKVVNNDKQRKKRLKNRIQRIFDKGRTYFVTLTFNNDALNDLSADTRREYVTSVLKSISSDYVANIDFGAKSGREHYHAVIYCTLFDDIKYFYSKRYGWINIDAQPLMQWRKYGWFSVKSCGTDNTDKSRLAWYVSKLANHAVKETTKRYALIYSR